MAFTFKHGDRPLEGYQILRGVGRGGFGEVYYAVSDGGREVALKYLRENPEVELRGISSCINLKSPHLVSIFDVRRSTDGEYFVIMEYVSGPSLRDLLIAEPSGLGIQKAAFFIREIAKGLGYLHDRGIVHRDLKPGNIFYEDGYVKICDYGLSKFISVSRGSAQTASVGTVHYMAPEVGSGNYSKTIDIYALGVILYEMLLGRVPYEGASMGEVLMKHLTCQPEVDQLPQPFAGVIRRALAKDAAERFQVVGEMVEAIFGEEGVRRSVLGFEPASLSQVAARAARDVRPSPTPSDNPMPLPSPARSRLVRSGQDFSRRFVERTAGLSPRLTRKERRRQKRRQKNEQARKAELLGVEHDAAAGEAPDEMRLTFGKRVARLLTAVLTMAGACTLIGMFTKEPEVAAMSLGIMSLAILGISASHAIAGYLGADHPWLIDRVLTVACGAPAVGLLYGLSGEPSMESVLGGNEPHLPMLAVLALVDWRERISNGREGELGWWSAYVAGFVAFVVTKLTDHGGWSAALYLGGLAAAISLLLQVWAWAVVRGPRRRRDSANEVVVSPELPRMDDTQWAPPPPASRNEIRRAADPSALHGHDPRVAGVREPGFSARLAASLGMGARSNERSRMTRGMAAACALLSALVAGVLVLAACTGGFRGADDITAAVVAASMATMLAWMGLDKTRRLRRAGMWSEWINPVLRIFAGGALATGICMLAAHKLTGGDVAEAIIVVVLSSLTLLFLLIVRRGRVRSGEVASPSGLGEIAPPAPPVHELDSFSAAGRENEFIVPAPVKKS